MNTILASAMPPEALPADGQNIRAPDKHAALSRIKLLKNKRNPYIERWKAIRDYELPFLGEFDDTDDETDKGRRRDLAISNGVAWLANQAFAAGIMSGLTPPSRQWFKFGFSSDQENIEAERLLDERQAIVEADPTSTTPSTPATQSFPSGRRLSLYSHHRKAASASRHSPLVPTTLTHQQGTASIRFPGKSK